MQPRGCVSIWTKVHFEQSNQDQIIEIISSINHETLGKSIIPVCDHQLTKIQSIEDHQTRNYREKPRALSALVDTPSSRTKNFCVPSAQKETKGFLEFSKEKFNILAIKLKENHSAIFPFER